LRGQYADVNALAAGRLVTLDGDAVVAGPQGGARLRRNLKLLVFGDVTLELQGQGAVEIDAGILIVINSELQARQVFSSKRELRAKPNIRCVPGGIGKRTRRSSRPKTSRAFFPAGGIEGGISNGQDILVRGYLKPISTLRRPLGSVSFATREPVKAAYERSDVCVVPAAGVAAEAMVALTLARTALDKFGGDSMTETVRNFEGYKKQLREF